MFAAKIAVKSCPVERGQSEQCKHETLQQTLGSQKRDKRGEEIETEKKRERNEQSNLARMENVCLEPAAQRKSTHFNRDSR